MTALELLKSDFEKVLTQLDEKRQDSSCPEGIDRDKKDLDKIYNAFKLGKNIPKWKLSFLFNRIAGLYGMYCVYNARTRMYYIHCKEADYVYTEKDSQGEEHCCMTFVESRKSSEVRSAESFYDMLKSFYAIFELKYTGKPLGKSIKTMTKPDYTKEQ